MSETSDGQNSPAPGDRPPAQPLNYEGSNLDSARPMFRATMGVGITLGLLYVLSLPGQFWWNAATRQMYDRLGLHLYWSIALSGGEYAAGLGVLFISAMALFGRPAVRKWFVGTLVALMCCNFAYQVLSLGVWRLFTVPISSWNTNQPLWAVFYTLASIVSALAWPTLMLILVTRPILRPLFSRSAR